MNFFEKILIYKLGLRANSEYSTKDRMINYINWWNIDHDEEEFWFTSFVRNNVNVKNKINFYSVFGSPKYNQRRASRECDSLNIFFTGENIHLSGINKNLHSFGECRSCMDLFIGFDSIVDDSNYLRFPLWILYLFSPASTYEDIKKVISDINTKESKYENRYVDCSMISRHDSNGNRARICDSLSELFDIKYEGVWRNNSNLLKDKYSDRKLEYLSHVKFNICPENSNHSGYVTEKLFEAFMARTIPIYWGGDGSPESDIINESSFIYWDGTDRCYETIERLYKNKNDYMDFISQPIFKVGAEEVIWKYFQSLAQKINVLQENK